MLRSNSLTFTKPLSGSLRPCRPRDGLHPSQKWEAQKWRHSSLWSADRKRQNIHASPPHGWRLLTSCSCPQPAWLTSTFCTRPELGGVERNKSSSGTTDAEFTERSRRLTDWKTNVCACRVKMWRSCWRFNHDVFCFVFDQMEVSQSPLLSGTGWPSTKLPSPNRKSLPPQSVWVLL